jgi:hypothetical protein
VPWQALTQLPWHKPVQVEAQPVQPVLVLDPLQVPVQLSEHSEHPLPVLEPVHVSLQLPVQPPEQEFEHSEQPLPVLEPLQVFVQLEQPSPPVPWLEAAQSEQLMLLLLEFLQVFVQLEQLLSKGYSISGAQALKVFPNTMVPKTGSIPFAAFLKNTLLVWSSSILFSFMVLMH